jgi:hypothetical protein
MVGPELVDDVLPATIQLLLYIYKKVNGVFSTYFMSNKKD